MVYSDLINLTKGGSEKMMKPNRILVQIGNDIYAYQTGDFGGCAACDIEECESIRPMCRGIAQSFGDGAFFKRNLEVIPKIITNN